MLMQAAMDGKFDPPVGLEGSEIIGKLIPAAPGLPRYRTVSDEGKAGCDPNRMFTHVSPKPYGFNRPQ